MAQKSWFFNSAIGDPRVYQASDFAHYFGKVLSTGLLHDNNIPGLEVSAGGTSLTTTVAPGSAIMEGYAYENTGVEQLSHSVPEITLDRIDRVVLRLDKKNANRYIKLFVIEGEPSLEPVAPSLQRNTLVWELSLAQVRIRANTAAISPEDVLDERLDREVAGLVYSLISKPSPADIQKGGYEVVAETNGQTDFIIPLPSFDKVGDGLTVFVDGEKAALSSYDVVYPRIVRFKNGLPAGTRVEFDIIRGVVKIDEDYLIRAGNVGIADIGGYFESENVEGALSKIGRTLFSTKQKVYGVKIDLANADPHSSVEYLEDAIGISKPSDWDDKFPFNKIKPCMVKNGVFQFYLNPNDFSKKEDGTPSNHKTFDNGDVMIEFPKMFWSFKKNNNFSYIYLSQSKVDETYESIPFNRGSRTFDNIYISAYAACEGADGSLYSISGMGFKTNLSVDESRAKIITKGGNYQQIGLSQIFLLQTLFILKYKSLNSESKLGIAPTIFENKSGVGDLLGMDVGSLDGTTLIKYLGIEQLISKNHIVVDGYHTNPIAYTNVGYNFGSINVEDYEHILPGNFTLTTGFMKEGLFNNKFPFFPVSNFSLGSQNASSSTFFSDNVSSAFGMQFSGLPQTGSQKENGIFSWGVVGSGNLPQYRFVCFI